MHTVVRSNTVDIIGFSTGNSNLLCQKNDSLTCVVPNSCDVQHALCGRNFSKVMNFEMLGFVSIL